MTHGSIREVAKEGHPLITSNVERIIFKVLHGD